MGRLTWKKPDGTWGLNNMDIREVPGELYGAVCKLKDYEETGLLPEQIVEMDELYAEKCKEVAKLRKEVEAYQVIGTVEECREASERQKLQIPHIWGDGYDDKGNIIYDMYDCPNCGKSYEIDYDDYKYCPNCGQAIDKSDLK